MNNPKFRAWHKESKEMFKVMALNFDGECNLEQAILFNSEQFTTGAPAQIELMQWTGLPDDALTEIYEGDIIESLGRKYVIEFNMGAFLAFAQNKGGAYDIYRLDGYKIIGNKWENPELLEQIGVLKQLEHK